MRYLIVLLVLVLLGGCVAPYSQFYKDEIGGFDVTTSPHYEIPEGEPTIRYSNFKNIENDNISMKENRYKRLGNSSWNGEYWGEDGVVAQAKKVHASVVILYSKYTDTESGSLPITTQDTQTSSTDFMGDVNSGNLYGTSGYGSGGGYSSFSGTATTTTTGSKTIYVPFHIRRFDQAATFWIRKRDSAFKLGVTIIDLTPEARQALGSNKGVLIKVVIKNSPAFHADIINGDILLKVGEVEIYNAGSVQNAVGKYAGMETEVVVWRNGNEINKNVRLNP